MSEKVELCCSCDEPTGKAGWAEDSLYDDLGYGPYCEECYENKVSILKKTILGEMPPMRCEVHDTKGKHCDREAKIRDDLNGGKIALCDACYKSYKLRSQEKNRPRMMCLY